jgi:hypothetical protein
MGAFPSGGGEKLEEKETGKRRESGKNGRTGGGRKEDW